MTNIRSKEFSDFRQIAIVARYELLKHLRRRRLYAVIVITVMISALQIVARFALNVPFPAEATNWASGFLSFVTFLIIIVGTFFAGDAIASEYEHKTGFIIFPNPVKRYSLVIGKFIAAFVSALLTLVVYYAIGVGSILGIYGFVPWQVAESLAYATLYICCALGFTFLFSSLLRGSMGATLLSFFTFFLIFQIAGSLIMLTGNEPWYVPTYAGEITTQTLNPQNDTVTEIPGSPLKIYIFYPKLPISIIVLAVYFVATLALSIIISNRKEMA